MFDDLPYFAYGSNVDPIRFEQRCPAHKELGTPWLRGWCFAFAGRSRMWRGGVGTLHPQPGSAVQGVLYRLTRAHWDTLDRIEGHPDFYRRVQVTVEDQLSWTYLLPEDTPEEPPTPEYLAAVTSARLVRGWDPSPWRAAATRAGL